MYPHKFLTKNIFYVASVKKIKICPVNSHMFIHKFDFFIRDTKKFFLSKNWRVNIVCPDIYEKNLFQFFDILKYIF
jgi:hypothetical protein